MKNSIGQGSISRLNFEIYSHNGIASAGLRLVVREGGGQWAQIVKNVVSEEIGRNRGFGGEYLLLPSPICSVSGRGMKVNDLKIQIPLNIREIHVPVPRLVGGILERSGLDPNVVGREAL